MGCPVLLDLQLETATILKNALEALSDTFTKASFDFSVKGCEIQAADADNVALVALLLPPELFKKYCCCKQGLSIAMNLADMAEVFRCVNNDDSVTIQAELDFSNIVTFTFESPGDGDVWSFDFVYEDDIDSVPYRLPKDPESEYQSIVRMPSAKFMRVCKKLSCSGDRDTAVIVSVKKKGDKEGVFFDAKGKIGNSTFFCSQTQTVSEPKEYVVIDMKEEVSQIFDLWYMNSFSKMYTLSEEVKICLSSEEKNLPLFMYKILGKGYIRYYLVPRLLMKNEGDEINN